MSRLLLRTTLRPVIVTDAGLQNPWLRAVAAPGWGFGGRVRGRVMLVGDADNDWEPVL